MFFLDGKFLSSCLWRGWMIWRSGSSSPRRSLRHCYRTHHQTVRQATSPWRACGQVTRQLSTQQLVQYLDQLNVEGSHGYLKTPSASLRDVAKQHRQVTWRSTDGSQETGDVHSVSTRDIVGYLYSYIFISSARYLIGWSVPISKPQIGY